MKKNVKIILGIGVVCLLSMLAASWYAVVYNESRLVVPMDFSEYVFTVKDLPMICALAFALLYLFFLFGLLIRTIIINKKKESTASITRKISPKFGFFGLFGFFGFLGFWTYSTEQEIFPFIYFVFFGFFGFFYEGKMSNTFMDERYQENKRKAHLKASETALNIIFIALFLLGLGERILGSSEYTLIAFVIIVAFSLALYVFLGEYLLYRYDHDERPEESEG